MMISKYNYAIYLNLQVTPTTSNTSVTRQSGMSSTQVAVQPIDNSKIQEE